MEFIRCFETASTVEGETYFRDVWDGSGDDHRHLSEPRAGIVRFHWWPEIRADGNINIRGRRTRAQVAPPTRSYLI
eukprot:9475732-Pyramimonas_sp.AAC.2